MVHSSKQILLIHSDKKELSKVKKFLEDTFSLFNIKRVFFNKVYLCISEAVVNAIEHGNHNIFQKIVEIVLYYTEDQMVVRVCDEGSGFNYKCVIDPTLKENIKKESGRGIHIIRSFSDKTEYNKKGNEIKFVINFK